MQMVTSSEVFYFIFSTKTVCVAKCVIIIRFYIPSIFSAKNETPRLRMFHFSAAVKKEVYFMAIIDILTHYDAKKKAAHAAKTVKHGVSIGMFLHNPLNSPLFNYSEIGRLV